MRSFCTFLTPTTVEIINNPNIELHFDLNDLDGPMWQEIMNPNRSVTNKELNQLYQNKDAFNRTIFYRNGEKRVGEAAFEIF